MYDITAIKNYIFYLKTQCGLFISLHPNSNDTLIIPSELMTFNIHDNSYCIYIKTFPEAQKHCVKNQNKIIEKCTGGSFCGVCYAGVKEYVYPIKSGNKITGFISVSGYRTDSCDTYIKKISHNFSIPEDKLKDIYTTLKKEIPPKTEIDTLIMPLLNMLELAYIKSDIGTKKKESLTDRVIRYLKQYRAQSITCEDICRKFSCSRSHLSHSFKRETGKGIKEYLTELRIEDAKFLLSNSKLTVTEIAFSVGFGDSNYFSDVFKRKVGIPPRITAKEILIIKNKIFHILNIALKEKIC